MFQNHMGLKRKFKSDETEPPTKATKEIQNIVKNEQEEAEEEHSSLQRNAANERERVRMRVLSKAFVRLKSALPWVPVDTKLSKLDTLRLASSYIQHLRHVLATDLDYEPKAMPLPFPSSVRQGIAAAGKEDRGGMGNQYRNVHCNMESLLCTVMGNGGFGEFGGPGSAVAIHNSYQSFGYPRETQVQANAHYTHYPRTQRPPQTQEALHHSDMFEQQVVSNLLYRCSAVI